MLEGTLELQIAGEAPRRVKAGESFFVPAGVVHDGKNVGKGLTRALGAARHFQSSSSGGSGATSGILSLRRNQP